MAFYDNRGKPKKTYQNADGPGGSTIDYGDPRGLRQDQRYQNARDQYGNSPWYGRAGDANPMPYSSDPSARGKQTPFFTPDAGDPRNAGYYIQADPAKEALKDQAIGAAHQANRDAYAADPAYAQAAQGGDLKAAIARMQQMKQGQQRQNFIDQGGQGSTWDTRFQQSWPVPASTTGTYQYGPGQPGPTPPGVPGGAAGAPPSATSNATGVPSGMLNPSGTAMTQGAGTGGSGFGAAGGGQDQSPAGGGGNQGWRKQFKRSFVQNGGSGPNFSGDQAGINQNTMSYRQPVDTTQTPQDFNATLLARDQMRKQAMGIPAKFLDFSRRDAGTGIYR